MAPSKNIHWFPGHMAKTERELKSSLKLVDLTAEVIDARVPISSRNPDLSLICEGKPGIVILNKTDMVDDYSVKKWMEFYKRHGVECVPFSIKSNQSVKKFISKVQYIMKEKIDSWKSKGMCGRSVRIMVVGIPNVGKSAFINKLAKNAKAKVENKPGVTRKNQWFSVGSNIEILDTPGVLWHKFNDKDVAYNLAFTGAIKDSVLDTEDLAFEFIKKIKLRYCENLAKRYKISPEDINSKESHEILEAIGASRGMKLPGGKTDILRTSEMLLEEFRSGKLGKLTLEYPEI